MLPLDELEELELLDELELLEAELLDDEELLEELALDEELPGLPPVSGSPAPPQAETASSTTARLLKRVNEYETLIVIGRTA